MYNLDIYIIIHLLYMRVINRLEKFSNELYFYTL